MAEVAKPRSPARRHLARGAAALVVALALGRLLVFMVSATSTAFSALPDDAFYHRHSCATAYFEAGRMGGERRQRVRRRALSRGQQATQA